VVKTGKSKPGMAAVLREELERELESCVLKFSSTFAGRAEGLSGVGRPK
jgi:hypothetical protein